MGQGLRSHGVQPYFGKHTLEFWPLEKSKALVAIEISTLRHARLNGQRLKVARPLGAAQQLTKRRLPRLDQ